MNQIAKVLAKIVTSILKGGKGSTKVDLALFKNKLPGNQGFGGPGKWRISKDGTQHGASRWKLFKDKERIASLGEDGEVVGD